MRRFRQGATKGPSLNRPGAGYGRICFGAPGPTQEIEPREELVPDLFTQESKPESVSNADDFASHHSDGDTIIDLTKNSNQN